MKCTRQRCQVALVSTSLSAACSPAWLSLITNCTPCRPCSTRCRRKLNQKSRSSAPMANPNTSRSPVSCTPMASTTACDTMRWLTRTLTYKASNQTYG